MSNRKKLTKSAVIGQLPILVQIASGLVIMPLMISYFGDRYYGLWVLAATFLGYFGLMDFGISKAIIRFVSRALGRNDKIESNGWLSLGLFLLFCSSILGVIILIPIILSLHHFVSPKDLILFRKILLVVGVTFLIELPSKGFIGLLQAHVRADVIDTVISVISALRMSIFWIAIEYEIQFISFFYILSASVIIQALFITFFALKIHGNFTFQKNYITKNNFKLFFDYSGFSFIAQLADILRFKAYPVIISSFLGLAAITPFEIANRIRTILGQVHNKIFVNFVPIFSQIESKFGIGDELKNSFLFSYKLSTYFVVFSVGIVAIMAPDFIAWWIGPEYNLAVTLLLIGLIGNFAAGIQIPTVCYLFGTSKHRFYALTNSIEAFLIILSAILLVKKFGLIGIVAGASLSTFIVKTFVQPILITKDLKISLFSVYLKNTLLQIFKVILFLLLPFYLSYQFLEPKFIQLLIFGAITSLLFIPYILFFGFNKKERLKLISLVPFMKKFKFYE